MKLKPYMAYDGQIGSSEGAALIFAHNTREAKKTAFPILSGWGCDWLDVRAIAIKDGLHLFAEGDQDKIAAGTPHAIESPASCKECELWGHFIHPDGICENCKDSIETEPEVAWSDIFPDTQEGAA